MLRPPSTSPHLPGTLGRAEILGSLQDTVSDLRPQTEGCSHCTRFFHTARSLCPGPEPSKMLILKVSCPSLQAPLPPSPCSALQPPNGSERLGEHHTGVQSSGQPHRAAHNHAQPCKTTHGRVQPCHNHAQRCTSIARRCRAVHSHAQQYITSGMPAWLCHRTLPGTAACTHCRAFCFRLLDLKP